ncbi:hypothetical protein PENSTE_c006G03880 [Penicillium steckii]|uniref:Uncharacterized protein n=1 Tax=Penicillium steckii TaxID=303698 RepID=A0A1V6TFW3_9EURO|nr:hypothetical protein PENSTE_c006G03880 [Penicillium steckii]
MKLLLALCVTSILALLIQSTFTHDTSTSGLSSSTKGPSSEEKPPQLFITSRDKANTAQSILSEFDIEPDSSQGRLYGTFPDETNNIIPTEKHSDAPASPLKKESCNYFQYIAVYFNQAQQVDLFESHRPEFLALAIILLFPLAYLVLEFIERVVKRLTCEEFPRLGRNRVRLTGPKRQFRACTNERREISPDEKSADNKI